MILLNEQRIIRTLKRMAYQIEEEAKSKDIVLAGLNKRGFILANFLFDELNSFRTKSPEIYRIFDEPKNPSDAIPTPSGEAILVVVDDVIFSGGTMFRAIRKVPELDSYEKILTAVLVDRGHRKYPVLASIVGFHAPTKLNEHVELQTENELPKKVVLTN
ncbi:MAG TPA: phosphoribosyltransferase family protein [Balneolaceae bacterium]|nr:phosphoribosyltransferase family protein [Balneolaceae bacterium]